MSTGLHPPKDEALVDETFDRSLDTSLDTPFRRPGPLRETTLGPTPSWFSTPVYITPDFDLDHSLRPAGVPGHVPPLDPPSFVPVVHHLLVSGPDYPPP